MSTLFLSMTFLVPVMKSSSLKELSYHQLTSLFLLIQGMPFSAVMSHDISISSGFITFRVRCFRLPTIHPTDLLLHLSSSSWRLVFLIIWILSPPALKHSLNNPACHLCLNSSISRLLLISVKKEKKPFLNPHLLPVVRFLKNMSSFPNFPSIPHTPPVWLLYPLH